MRLFARFLPLLLSATLAHGYGPEHHQSLTFLAAKAVNRCLEGTEIDRLSALQVRYLVRANVALADRSFVSRMFRWNYYNRSDGAEHSVWGVIDTRLHEHFNELLLRLEERGDSPKGYADLGRIVSYVQDVTTPSRAVPVFSNRWWRFSFSDRFDSFPVDLEAVEAAIDGSCPFVLAASRDFDEILADAAGDTLTAVQAPIFGLPVTWEAYWELADDGEDFGEYGRAGNSFGREVVFRCGEEERCVLLDNDPLYQGFAQQRHVTAVLATMRALILFQRSRLAATQGSAEQPIPADPAPAPSTVERVEIPPAGDDSEAGVADPAAQTP